MFMVGMICCIRLHAACLTLQPVLHCRLSYIDDQVRCGADGGPDRVLVQGEIFEDSYLCVERHEYVQADELGPKWVSGKKLESISGDFRGKMSDPKRH